MDRGTIGKKELLVTLACLFFVLLAFYLVILIGNILALFLYLELVIVTVLTFVPLFLKYKKEFIKFLEVLIFQAELNEQGVSFLEITEAGSKYSFRSGIAAFVTGVVLSLIAFDLAKSEIGGVIACVSFGVFPGLALSKLVFPYFGKKCIKPTNAVSVIDPSKVVLTLYLSIIALFLLIVIISHWDSTSFSYKQIKVNIMNKPFFSGLNKSH